MQEIGYCPVLLNPYAFLINRETLDVKYGWDMGLGFMKVGRQWAHYAEETPLGNYTGRGSYTTSE